MTKYISTLIFLILFSCGSRPSDSIATDTETDSLAISNSEDKEEFSDFFDKFTTDSLFQMERTQFPFRVLWATEDGETVHETAKENWRHSTFYYENNYSSRQVDAYTQEAKDYGDTVRLELRGVDNGIFIDYNFVRDKGKWILVSGKDFSN
ncbi:MAG: DUF4348 domain-containing protein [Cyclobacteriaceae bacterium]